MQDDISTQKRYSEFRLQQGRKGSGAMSRKIDKFRGEYYFLSNFYPAHVEYDGIAYKNNEAAFQAQKCARQEDKKQFANIDDPVIAKRLGAKVLLRRDWESVKLSIMKDIVKAKFVQNPELARKLLETKDAYIEEGNTWSDRFWGTYLGEGQNHLGKIIMEVRSELQKEMMKAKQYTIER